MKKLFPGRYRPTEAEFKLLFDNCFFVVDANLLLNLYRYSDETRKDWLSLLNIIKERLWLPYQVATEYQRNRLEVIRVEKNKYDKINVHIEDLKNSFESGFSQFWRFAPKEVTSWQTKVNTLFDDISKSIKGHKDKHPDLYSNDTIREAIDALFVSKIGDPYTEDFIDKTSAEAKRRYEKSIPPGFKDKKKDEDRRFGDYFLWREIINKAKDVKKPAVFITDDAKEDWWEKSDGKTIGPHPELVDEFVKGTEQSIYFYNSDNFFEHANKHFSLKVENSSILETKAVEGAVDKKRNRARILALEKILSDYSQMYIEKVNLLGSSAAASALSATGMTVVPNSTLQQISNLANAPSLGALSIEPYTSSIPVDTSFSKVIDYLNKQSPLSSQVSNSTKKDDQGG